MYLQKVMSKKTERKKIFFIGVLKVTEEKEQDPELDPDPLVRGMDPRIRTKISRIRNTG
jgi:hypothetical protein